MVSQIQCNPISKQALRVSDSWCLAIGVVFACASIGGAAEIRIKDITSVQGARSNKLFGQGLVVGLNNTGGRSVSTQQVAIDMLRRLEVNTKISRQQITDNVFKSGNISHVMVTADLPSFARQGSKLDVVVSVLDDAQSLQGGTLIMTPLYGADGEVYATAQGQLSIGGFYVRNNIQGSQINHPTVARAVNAADVEREALGQFDVNGIVRLNLHSTDFGTAKEIMLAINRQYPACAKTLDPGTVQIRVPLQYLCDIPTFIGEIGQLAVMPDATARIIINERTGTVVVGHHVRISSLQIAHGNLTIKPNVVLTVQGGQNQPSTAPSAPPKEVPGLPPKENPDPIDDIMKSLRPNPLPLGDGKGRPLAAYDAEQTFSVADLARALTGLGATPRDMIAIFQMLKQSGALHADVFFE